MSSETLPDAGCGNKGTIYAFYFSSDITRCHAIVHRLLQKKVMIDTCDLKVLFEALCKDVDQAFEALAKKRGLSSLAMGKLTYNDSNFSFKSNRVLMAVSRKKPACTNWWPVIRILVCGG
ncbi:hypothetical protein E4K72_19760 [Oxalobacteraceae bacterium OM1]|nr:hypothetical protein E4K72_19760 [Oxalobacteraceae bacterium OM1]